MWYDEIAEIFQLHLSGCYRLLLFWLLLIRFSISNSVHNRRWFFWLSHRSGRLTQPISHSQRRNLFEIWKENNCARIHNPQRTNVLFLAKICLYTLGPLNLFIFTNRNSYSLISSCNKNMRELNKWIFKRLNSISEFALRIKCLSFLYYLCIFWLCLYALYLSLHSVCKK